MSSQLPAGIGALVGRVTRGPTSPVQGIPGRYGPAPAAGLVVVASALQGGFSRSAVTEADGGFQVSLPPGAYQVTIPSLTGLQFSKDLPASVVIAAGRKTHLDIHIDTGIR